MRRPLLAVLAAATFSMVVTGCVGMPESGPVVQTDTTGASAQDQAVNINPRRPGKDDTPEEIVRGFLEAMTATPPIKTSVAREFLTKEAAALWQPTETIIYSTVSTQRGNQEVTAVLEDAQHTDSRGAWLGPLTEAESTLTFPVELELEDDQWRIAAAPNALIVPQSWFEQRFRQAALYFFDPTGTLLVPDPVFVPRGRQFASALINGLLAGPTPDLARELSFLPADLRSVVSVPVSTDGVAQVELTSDTAQDVVPDPDEAELLVSQLAWTLRQDTSISSFRVSIGGRPVQLPDQSTTFGVDHGHEYAPYIAGSSTQLFGLRDQIMVGGSAQNLEPVAGPFGTGTYGLRAVAPDVRADLAAAVTTSGTQVLTGPVRTGVTPVASVATGENFLKPAWDFSGRLWIVDRRRSGSVVSYLQDGRLREVQVDGVSGGDVKDFLVSRDGTRLVTVLRVDGTEDVLQVSRIVTGGDGRVLRVLPAVSIDDSGEAEGVIRDIAWRSPTSVLVLHPTSRRLFQVRTASVDGSPIGGGDAIALPLDRLVLSLAGTPVPGETLYAFAHAVLSDLAGPRGNTVPIDPGVTSLDYVG